MDYLVIIFLSLLTPFSLSLSDIDYNTGFGVKISDSTSDSIISNRISAKPIKTGTRSDNEVVSAEHYGPYGILYDLSIEYQVYPFVHKDSYLQNFWIAPKFSYEPLRDSALVLIKPSTSNRTKAISIMFNQHPSFGFNIGYDAYHFDKGGEILSPYFGMQFMRVGYEGESNFDMQELFDSSIQYNLGLNYKMDENWAANIEMSTTFVDIRASEGLDQDMTLKITRVKFGVIYYLANSIDKQKENKDNTYIGILKSIDPNFKNRVKEKRRLEEEAKKEKDRAAKEAKEAEKANARAEQEAKEQAEQLAEQAAKEAERAVKEAERESQGGNNNASPARQQADQPKPTRSRLQGRETSNEQPRRRFLGVF
ncbi:MAG: hypothetical protein LBH40_01310 [Alphaproteobacteria bacterium]|jgi:flagellar biosynthesis GTPase FlhF|nr:hypothetical protein [Alphaproteobacteria bacterium]